MTDLRVSNKQTEKETTAAVTPWLAEYAGGGRRPGRDPDVGVPHRVPLVLLLAVLVHELEVLPDRDQVLRTRNPPGQGGSACRCWDGLSVAAVGMATSFLFKKLHSTSLVECHT